MSPKQYNIQVDYPFSEMLGSRNVCDFAVFQILEHLHRLYWNIPNLKSGFLSK